MSVHRVGIVGANNIGARHPESPPPPFKNQIINSHLACLSLIQRVQLVGVCDLDPQLLKEFKKHWGYRWPKTNTYTDYKEMLSEENLDILHIVTPEHLHADITVDATASGIKGIFCEKPLSTTLKDADRMIKACENNNVTLISGYTRRWRPLYHTVRDAIRDDKIGDLGAMVATEGGYSAALFRQGTHAIDAMCFFAESDPVKVFATLDEGFDGQQNFIGGAKSYAHDPGATGIILFRNGIRGIYCGTKNTFDMNSLQLSGPKGQIYFHLNDMVAKLTTMGVDRNSYTSTLVPNEYQVQAMVAAFEELLDLVENGGSSISTAREGRKTVNIMEGFMQSEKEGGRLIDLPN